MNEKDDDITHPGMLSNPKKHLILPHLSNSPWTRARRAMKNGVIVETMMISRTE
jgi:hypothetical protein